MSVAVKDADGKNRLSTVALKAPDARKSIRNSICVPSNMSNKIQIPKSEKVAKLRHKYEMIADPEAKQLDDKIVL